MTQDRLGMPEEEFENEKGALTGKFLQLETGPNIHHVVFGFNLSHQTFIPTVVLNETSGKLNRTQRVVDVLKPDTGYYDSLVGKLINILWELNEKHGQKGSPISVSKRAIGAVFNEGETVDANNPPKLQIVSYPVSVVQDERNNTGLYFLQKAKTLTDPPKLMYGPMWAFKSVIEKIVDSSLTKKTGTSYSVRFLTEDPRVQSFIGKLPLNALEPDYDGYEKLFNLAFTEAERQVIDETKDDVQKQIKNVYKPLSDIEMLEHFEKNPIDLTAKNPDGTPLFLYAEEVMKKFQTYDVKLLESSSEIDENPQQRTTQVASEDDITDVLNETNEVSQAPTEAAEAATATVVTTEVVEDDDEDW